MVKIIRDKWFVTIVAIPTFLWLLVCVVYVSASVGWGNLSYLLPHEFVAFVIGIGVPIFLLTVVFIFYSKIEDRGALSDIIALHSSKISDLTKKTDEVIKVILENRQYADNAQDAILETRQYTNNAQDAILEAIKGSHLNVTSAIKANGAGIEDIAAKLSAVIYNEQEKARAIGPNDINQQTALLGLLGIVLNDINVSATRLLVRLMEKEGRSREEAKDFIQGLVSAYSLGDRDVFFNVLRHQLVNNPERINSLRLLATEFSGVGHDLSKIMMESHEIAALMQRFGKNDVINVLFDDATLRSLTNVLEPHFNVDGTAKVAHVGEGVEEI